MRKFLLFILFLSTLLMTFGVIPPLPANAGYLDYVTATMKSAQTVYCLPGSGMTIGSVSSNESIKVFWKEYSYYYIEYVVSSGSYSGYKRGYVPASSVNTGASNIPSNNFNMFYARTTASKTVYNRSTTSSMVIGTVYDTDNIKVLNIENNSWCYIEYPISGGSKRGYVSKNDIASLMGNLEAISYLRIVGWAWNPADPDKPINVEITIHNNSTGQNTILTTTADIGRADLQQAGIGNGFHGYECKLSWSIFSFGSYSVTAKALYGLNPQIGPTLTYNYQSKAAPYYYVARNWPNQTNPIIWSKLNNMQYYFTGMTYAPSLTDCATASNIISGLQSSVFVTIHGLGGIGYVYVKSGTNNSQWLYSSFQSTYTLQTDIPANAMTNTDIVAFLSSYSSVTPTGHTNPKSLAQVVLDKGAKVSIGFDGNVSGAEYWYDYFLFYLCGVQENTYTAYLRAIDDAQFYGDAGNSADLVRIYRHHSI